MEPEITERDSKILRILSGEINGLGYNELLRQTDFNKKTLTSHLKRLEEFDLITKQKLGKKQNSPTFYKARLDPSIKSFLEMGFEINASLVGSDYTFAELSKIGAISALPHMFLGLTTSYYQSVLEYMTNNITRMELQFVNKVLIDFIDDWKEQILKKLSAKNIERLHDEGLTYQSSEIDRINWMTSDAMERKELRTSYEIKLASETISPMRIIWCEERVKNKKRSDLIKDPKKKKEYQQLEEKYLETLDQLVSLQRKLIGRFEDYRLHVFDTSDEYGPNRTLTQVR